MKVLLSFHRNGVRVHSQTYLTGALALSGLRLWQASAEFRRGDLATVRWL